MYFNILFLLLACSLVQSEHFNKSCDGFQATINLKDVLGTWHAVAIIPEKLFPDRDVNCYRVEFSEADEVREHFNKYCDGFQATINLKDVLGTWYAVAIIPEKLFPDRDVNCYRVEFSEADEVREHFNKYCDGFQATINLKDVLGTWHAVAIIPEKLFPDRDVNCYRVEFSEADEVREHFNKSCDGFQATINLKDVLGTWHAVAIIPEKLFPDRDVNCYRVEFSEADEVREHFNKSCDGFQATINLKDVLGTWHAVAIIPEKLFPDRDVNCYRVEFSEADEVREHFNKSCDGFQATINLKDVLGTWHAVAIIPEKLFPDRDVNCYRVEFSEADEGGLRWIISNTKQAAKEKPNKELSAARSKRTSHTIVRLRYHTEEPFDVWSKSVEGVNGCFIQVLSMDVGANDTHNAKNHDAMMQLHNLHSHDDGPYLVQMLWGRLISAVIYRRHPGVSQDQLKPVFNFLEKLRGPQRLPKICDNPMRNFLLYNDNNHKNN